MKIGTRMISAAMPSMNMPKINRKMFTSNRKTIVLSEMETIHWAICCGIRSNANIHPKILAMAIKIVMTAVVETVLIKIFGICDSFSSR